MLDATTAWVGLCCEPVVGAILSTTPPQPASYDGPPTYGYNPAVDPSGRYLATGQIVGAGLSISPVDGDGPAITPSGDDSDTISPYDVMWLGERHVAVLGIGSSAGAWVARIVEFDGTTATVVDDVVVAPFDRESTYRFAGPLDGGRLGVHAEGSARVLAVPVLGAPGEIETIDLDAPARSVWFGGIEPTVVVGVDRTLRVGDEIVPGEFLWARR